MIKIYYLSKMPASEKALIMQRSRTDILSVKETVSKIIEDIKKNGDKALSYYTEKFDGAKLNFFKVSEKEIKNAYAQINPVVLKAIKEQIKLSKKFASAQYETISKSWQIQTTKGVVCGEKVSPIESVGLYVPGGCAAYPTVMQILAVPAKIAQVKRIVAATPPQKDGTIKPELLVAADLSGVDEIYKIGGAQAIAALAYGTETIKQVLKVVGPGNIYVTAAKLLCFGEIAIDMPAGPSEAVILADENANPKFVAADILAKAEHDPNAAAVLVTPSEKLAAETILELKKQLLELSRFGIAEKSLSKYSAIILTRNLEEAISFANEYAPEHLEVQIKNPWKFLQRIKNAGSIFLGSYAPIAAGDYASGANHVLPTGQYAKMFSPIGVEAFLKKSEFQYMTKSGLESLNKKIIAPIAGVEGFDGHAKSVSVRIGVE